MDWVPMQVTPNNLVALKYKTKANRPITLPDTSSSSSRDLQHHLGNNYTTISSSNFFNVMTSENTTTNSSSIYPDDVRDERIAVIEVAVSATILFLAVVGNGCVIGSLYMRKRRRLSRMLLMILHLSLADLFVAFFNVLPQLVWDITFRFQGGGFLCKAVKYFQLVAMYASAYVLLATATDRYLAICHPFLSQKWTPAHAHKMVGLAWIASLVFSFPQLFIFSLTEVEDGVYDCWAHFDPMWTLPTYITWNTVSIFVVPTFVLACLYGKISLVVWRAGRLDPENITRGTVLPSESFQSNQPLCRLRKSTSKNINNSSSHNCITSTNSIAATTGPTTTTTANNTFTKSPETHFDAKYTPALNTTTHLDLHNGSKEKNQHDDVIWTNVRKSSLNRSRSNSNPIITTITPTPTTTNSFHTTPKLSTSNAVSLMGNKEVVNNSCNTKNHHLRHESGNKPIWTNTGRIVQEGKDRKRNQSKPEIMQLTGSDSSFPTEGEQDISADNVLTDIDKRNTSYAHCKTQDQLPIEVLDEQEPRDNIIIISYHPDIGREFEADIPVDEDIMQHALFGHQCCESQDNTAFDKSYKNDPALSYNDSPDNDSSEQDIFSHNRNPAQCYTYPQPSTEKRSGISNQTEFDAGRSVVSKSNSVEGITGSEGQHVDEDDKGVKYYCNHADGGESDENVGEEDGCIVDKQITKDDVSIVCGYINDSHICGDNNDSNGCGNIQGPHPPNGILIDKQDGSVDKEGTACSDRTSQKYKNHKYWKNRLNKIRFKWISKVFNQGCDQNRDDSLYGLNKMLAENGQRESFGTDLPNSYKHSKDDDAHQNHLFCFRKQQSYIQATKQHPLDPIKDFKTREIESSGDEQKNLMIRSSSKRNCFFSAGNDNHQHLLDSHPSGNSHILNESLSQQHHYPHSHIELQQQQKLDHYGGEPKRRQHNQSDHHPHHHHFHNDQKQPDQHQRHQHPQHHNRMSNSHIISLHASSQNSNSASPHPVLRTKLKSSHNNSLTSSRSSTSSPSSSSSSSSSPPPPQPTLPLPTHTQHNSLPNYSTSPTSSRHLHHRHRHHPHDRLNTISKSQNIQECVVPSPSTISSSPNHVENTNPPSRSSSIASKHRSSSTTSSYNKNNIAATGSARRARRVTPGISRAKLKTIKLTLTVVICYVICWLPFFAGQMWAAFDENAPFQGASFSIIMLLASVNSCTNPWIYTVFSNTICRHARNCLVFAAPSHFMTPTSQVPTDTFATNKIKSMKHKI